MENMGFAFVLQVMAGSMAGVLPKIAVLIGAIMLLGRTDKRGAAGLTVAGTILTIISILTGAVGTVFNISRGLAATRFALMMSVNQFIAFTGAALFAVGFIIHVAGLKKREG